jgi:hypothetical protein
MSAPALPFPLLPQPPADLQEQLQKLLAGPFAGLQQLMQQMQNQHGQKK